VLFVECGDGQLTEHAATGEKAWSEDLSKLQEVYDTLQMFIDMSDAKVRTLADDKRCVERRRYF